MQKFSDAWKICNVKDKAIEETSDSDDSDFYFMTVRPVTYLCGCSVLRMRIPSRVVHSPADGPSVGSELLQ
jgi:hypothetical protein